MTPGFYITYFCVVFIATITPGPSMLMAIKHGLHYGTRKSILSALSNAIGNIVIALISLAGLRAVLAASETLFWAIKLTGVFYLLYIGIRTFFEPVPKDLEAQEPLQKKDKSSVAIIVEGFFIAVGNPKGILFFTALFPQFINISTATLNEFTVVFVTLGVIAFVGYVLYAATASRLRQLFYLPRFRKVYNRITGGAFVGCGLAMAFAKSKE